MASLFEYPDVAQSSDQTSRFLADWSDEDWARLLVNAEMRRFRQGEFVIRAGDRDRALFIVAEGLLEVIGPKGRTVASIGEGSLVGEQVFVDGHERTADVRAVTPAALLRLSLSNFETFAVAEPELALSLVLDIARILSLRLREATRTVSMGR